MFRPSKILCLTDMDKTQKCFIILINYLLKVILTYQDQLQPIVSKLEQSVSLSRRSEFNENLGFCVPTDCPEDQVLDEQTVSVCWRSLRQQRRNLNNSLNLRNKINSSLLKKEKILKIIQIDLKTC
jgi:hypothetical protein